MRSLPVSQSFQWKLVPPTRDQLLHEYGKDLGVAMRTGKWKRPLLDSAFKTASFASGLPFVYPSGVEAELNKYDKEFNWLYGDGYRSITPAVVKNPYGTEKDPNWDPITRVSTDKNALTNDPFSFGQGLRKKEREVQVGNFGARKSSKINSVMFYEYN